MTMCDWMWTTSGWISSKIFSACSCTRHGVAKRNQSCNGQRVE